MHEKHCVSTILLTLLTFIYLIVPISMGGTCVSVCEYVYLLKILGQGTGGNWVSHPMIEMHKLVLP